MNNDAPWYVSLIISFVPLIIVWAMMTWHGRQIRKSFLTEDGRSLAQVFDDLVREARRLNDRRDVAK
jgi:hypothetical protein